MLIRGAVTAEPTCGLVMTKDTNGTEMNVKKRVENAEQKEKHTLQQYLIVKEGH